MYTYKMHILGTTTLVLVLGILGTYLFLIYYTRRLVNLMVLKIPNEIITSIKINNG